VPGSAAWAIITVLSKKANPMVIRKDALCIYLLPH
jgi:hypothetical protein